MGVNSAVEKRCDEMASRYYRKQTPYCEASGKDSIVCDGVLDWGHVVSRRNRRLRYEPYNKLIICRGHHRYYTLHPLEWERFVRNHFPERWREIQEHKNEYMTAPNYDEWLDRFRN